jgi:hypothetical protein
MPKRDPAQLKKVSLSLPFGIGKAEWESDPSERRAAWCLYVELVTRVAVDQTPIAANGESEALASLYSLFSATREILKDAGPDIARSRESVGAIALAVLNRGVRPFLTKWHPLFEGSNTAKAPDSISVPNDDEFRTQLRTLQSELAAYAQALADIAGVNTL